MRAKNETKRRKSKDQKGKKMLGKNDELMDLEGWKLQIRWLTLL